MLYLDLKKAPEEVKKVCSKAFPSYNGTKVGIVYNQKQMNCQSYWSGGSKNYYALVRLQDCEVFRLPDSHPVFDNVDANEVDIPEGSVMIEHKIFCGKDLGLTIYTPLPSGFIEAPKEELTENEQKVLCIIGSITSSYRKDEYRRKEIPLSEVDNIKKSLTDKELLSKNGGITPKGRNVMQSIPKQYHVY